MKDITTEEAGEPPTNRSGLDSVTPLLRIVTLNPRKHPHCVTRLPVYRYIVYGNKPVFFRMSFDGKAT